MLSGMVALWESIPGLALASIIVVRARKRTPARHLTPWAWLASDLEQTTFFELERRYPPSTFLISAHMLLADVVGRHHLHELDEEDRAFAWRAHCDFVVVKRDTLAIIKVVEANGLQHGSQIQGERDRRKARLLHQFGIPLETVGVHRGL